MTKYFLIVAISLLAAFQSHAEKVESVQQNAIIGKSTVAPDASAFLGVGKPSLTIDIPPIQADLTSPIAGAYKTGVVYQLPSPITASQLPWESVNGGYVARILLVSDQAARLRYHLVFNQDIPSIEFRIQGSLDASPLGPIDSTFIQQRNLWLPLTNGSEADLEIFVNDLDLPETLDFSIDAVNLIVDDSNGITTKSLGLAMEKEYDLECASYFPEYYPALVQAANATTQMHFINGQSSYLCTGTLLNDKNNTHTPWLATAHHCISDQTTAGTASFEWFFRATTCGGSTTDTRYRQTYGGAQLLWTDSYLEASLLRLNQPVPNGVTFSGWDTNIHKNDLVFGVHHPEGDHTMVDLGYVTALLQTVIDADNGQSYLLNRVDYQYGGTEFGSSGSGLFSISNGSSYWKGTLTGGPVENYQVGYYSDFKSYYNSIKPWLTNSIECLLNWAENGYSYLFSPAGAQTQYQWPYTYRYYQSTNAYVGVSSINQHVYYLSPERVMQDVGALSGWLTTANCQ